jgi:serine/threonine-protein kinase
MSDAAHSPSPDVPTLAGSIIAGKYRVLRLIGSGGMGTVWEGSHVKLGTRVAIKFIRPQFAQQAEALHGSDRGAGRSKPYKHAVCP